MNLRIRYEWGEEELSATEVRPGVCRLTSFSEHVPLAPGDAVTVSGDAITGVERLADVFLVEAYFKMYATEDLVRECAAMWSQATQAQQTSGLTVAVTSRSLEWLTATVFEHDDVAHVEVVRTPGQAPFSFEKAVADA